jgi:predicted RNA binding protein YcfA (HicA-like mRNA interferase family)
MPPLPNLKPSEVVRILERLGYVKTCQKGSHIIFVHANGGQVQPVVPMHNRDLKKGMLRSIIRQTGLTVDEFIKYL